MRLSRLVKTISLLLIAGAFFTTQAFAAPMQAKIKSVTGKVELKSGDSWIQLKTGDIVKKGDVISTGFKSEAVITANEATFTLGALTRITFDELVSGTSKDKTSINLESGSVKADVSHQTKKADFTVRTPSATASVRGTSFSIDCMANLRVQNGMVAYYLTGSRAAKQAYSDFTDDDDGSETPESNQFTEAEEIAGAKGLGIYQGQATSTDEYSLTQSSPRETFAAGTFINGTGTSTLAEQEGTSLTASSGNSSTAAASSSGNKLLTAIVIFDVTVKE